MTLDEILKTRYFVCNLEWESPEHWIHEIEWPYDDYSYEAQLVTDGRIEWREHLSECPDGRRGRWINSLWFDGEAVFLTVASGRDGTEYKDRYIVNRPKFQELLVYLMQAIAPCLDDRGENYPLTHEINELYCSPLVQADFDTFWEERNKRLQSQKK